MYVWTSNFQTIMDEILLIKQVIVRHICMLVVMGTKINLNLPVVNIRSVSWLRLTTTILTTGPNTSSTLWIKQKN